jgi:D-arabinose 1-dehydrogenase-like Zn-dependent alcohol dehydrogenase
VHRVTTGTPGVLCQLDARVPQREIVCHWHPATFAAGACADPRTGRKESREARGGWLGMATKIVATAFGGPEVLSQVEADVPAPAEGEVTVAVKAAAVNPVDYKIVSGAMGADPDRLPLPVGLELAGVVTAVGPGAEGPAGPLAVDDEVIVTFPPTGAYADTVTVPAANVVPKPEGLPWAEARGR